MNLAMQKRTLLFLALFYPALAATAQPVHYHWLTETEVWLRRTPEASDYVKATLDAATETWSFERPDASDNNAWRDALRAAFPPNPEPTDPDSIWHGALNSLRTMPQDTWAQPWTPDVDLYVVDQGDNTTRVHILTRTSTTNRTFGRENGQWTTIGSFDNPQTLLSLGFDEFNTAALATLLSGRAPSPGDDDTDANTLWYQWLDDFATDSPRFFSYQADAPAGLQWVWQERLSLSDWDDRRAKKRPMAQPRPLPDQTTITENGDFLGQIAPLTWGLLALGLVLLAFWVGITFQRRKTKDASPKQLKRTGKSLRQSKVDQIGLLLSQLGKELEKADQVGQLMSRLAPELENLESHKSTIDAVLETEPETASKKLEAGEEVYRQYHELSIAPVLADWHPKDEEQPRLWFLRLFSYIETLEHQSKDADFQVQDIDLEIKKVKLELEEKKQQLDEARQAMKALDEKRSELSQKLETMEEDNAALKSYEERFDEFKDLAPLVENFQQGQRNFLDLEQNTATASVVSYLIHYSLTQLCLAQVTADTARIDLMYANLLSIAQTFSHYNGKALPGFQAAREKLQSRPRPASFDLSREPHADEKLFQILIKHLRDKHIKQFPFYYDLDDNGRAHGFK